MMNSWQGRSPFAKCGWIALLVLGGQLPVLPEESGAEARTVSHLDLDRPYRLHLPEGKTPEKPLPLVIALHGALTDGKITERLTGLSELADEKQFAVAYPDANPLGGVGFWDFWSPPIESPGSGKAGQRRIAYGRDDVGFVAAMMDALVDEGIADPRRIYVTGISNGAFMTNRLSIDLGERIAAIAPVAGTGLKVGALLAKPKRAMPVIYFHGTGDKIIGIDGSDLVSRKENSLSADEFAAWWVKRNGCVPEPVTESLPDLDKNDGCTVERLTWESGADAAPVIYYRIVAGGHSWPGGSDSQPKEILGNICRDIDASRLIWEFFTKHTLAEKP